MITSIVPGSAQAFNFKENFHLTEEEVSTLDSSSARLHVYCKLVTLMSFVAPQALEVSDHFPVEVDLKPNHRYLLRNEL